MEWNAARLKFPVLSGQAKAAWKPRLPRARRNIVPADCSFVQLCRIGLALTWPVVLAVLVALGAWLVVRYYRL